MTVSYTEYDTIPAVRASRLKLMSRSPLHYKEQRDKDTANRAQLRAIHAAALEPETFDRRFPVFHGRRAGADYDLFCAAFPDHESILNPKELEAVYLVVGGMLRHPIAGPLLTAPGRSEHTLTWTHEPTGLRCKARLDKWLWPAGDAPDNRHTIVDLKTYGTSDPRVIGNRVASLGAHLQAAHYVEGLAAELGIAETGIRYLLIVAEIDSPWDVAVVELEHDNALALGRSERDRLMARIAACEASGVWPGACPGIVPLELPAWADPLLQEGGDRIAASTSTDEETYDV